MEESSTGAWNVWKKVMSMAEYDRQAHLASIHEERKKTTDSKAHDAIDLLLHQGKAITFRSVSKLSGIGVATLYRHKRVRERIETLRDDASKAVPAKPKASTPRASDNSALIASLRRKIKHLEAENKKLREMNQLRLAEEWNRL